MKRIGVFGLFAFLLAVCNSRVAAQLQLAAGGSTNYIIRISGGASSTEQTAAKELQKYFQQVSDASIPVKAGLLTTSEKCIIVSNNLNYIKTLFPEVAVATLKDDGFLFKTRGQALLIFGGKNEGVLYGVYHFLERYLNCRYLAPEALYIPAQKNIILPGVDTVCNPKFDLRMVFTSESQNTDYSNWRGLQKFRNADWGNWAHSFFSLVPPATYFKLHPEYYALRNGKRVATQLCMSNPDVKQLLINNLAVKIKANPKARYWFVAQEDNADYCQCVQCQQINKQEGAAAGSLIRFVNDVAKVFPDKTIATLAYSYSQEAPKKTRPAENVLVVFCTSGNYNRIQSLASQGIQQKFVPWTALTRNILVWDYAVNFKYYQMPLPNFQAVADNVKFFSAYNIKGFFLQGNYYKGGAFDELRSYFLAILCWYPQKSAQSITDDFCDHYYGKAAANLKGVLQKLYLSAKSYNLQFGLFDDPASFRSNFLSNENILTYQNEVEKALALVKSDPVRVNRVEDFGSPFDFALLRNMGYEANSQNTSARQLAYKRLNNYYNRNGGSVIGEDMKKSSDMLAGYNELLTNPSGSYYLDNKALHKKVTNLYPSSKIHAGDGGLTDGIKGSLSLNNNSWVVFYGGRMSTTIDMGAQVSFSSVSSLFNEAAAVKMFFPATYKVSYSLDEKTYTNWGRLTITSYDKNSTNTSKQFTVRGNKIKARYIRVEATGPGLIGIDEIYVK
ncbi:MAG: DUF4838 domain-containing protein [Niabella sp.]